MSIAYKKNGVWVTASGTPPIDDALSATSENPVQNKIVKQAVDGADTNTGIVQAQVSNSDDAYDPTRPYAVGELCIHNDTLYHCITACSAGSWTTNQSCFTQDTLVNAIGYFISLQSIAENVSVGTFSISKTVTLSNGYPLFIAGYSFSRYADVMYDGVHLDGNTIRVEGYNNSGSSKDITAQVYVYCKFS